MNDDEKKVWAATFGVAIAKGRPDWTAALSAGVAVRRLRALGTYKDATEEDLAMLAEMRGGAPAEGQQWDAGLARQLSLAEGEVARLRAALEAVAINGLGECRSCRQRVDPPAAYKPAAHAPGCVVAEALGRTAGAEEGG